MHRYTNRSSSGLQASSVRFLLYQKQALAQVSRTFALTIPLLPTHVRHAIGNAYLLCRIADTVEDEPQLSNEHKRAFLDRFTNVVNGQAPADLFASDLAKVLSDATAKAERDLVLNTSAVVEYHENLSIGQRKPIERCIETMCNGMAEFVGTGVGGLPSMRHLDRYCYVVAGVVGEMITDILCDYSQDIESRRNQLFPLSGQFGRGLQLVNVLKDHREDRVRGVAWLPGKISNEVGDCSNRRVTTNIETRVLHVTDIAKRDLDAALRYVQLIPTYERRIRKFLTISLGLAVLTLRRIQANPGFQKGDEVKISRRQVYSTVAATNIAVLSNQALTWLFNKVVRF